jgi:hypothetical protein
MPRALLPTAVVATLWGGIAMATGPASGTAYRSRHFLIKLPPRLRCSPWPSRRSTGRGRA